MKKKNFVTLLLGTVGGVLFAVGMCMCLLPEWNAFTLGVVFASVGALTLAVLFAVRWKLDGRAFHLNWRLIGKIAYGVAAALVLGVGMCLVLVWQKMLLGIAIGLIGIVMLLCLIPLCLGLKNND